MQKKCLVVSSAVHGLLILILLFGSALMPNPEPQAPGHVLKMVSLASVSDAESSGGDPTANVAPAATPKAQVETAPPEAPKPQAEPPPTPKPVVEPPKPTPRAEVPKPTPQVERPKPAPRRVEKPKPQPVEEPTHWYDFSSKSKPKKEVVEEPAPPQKHKVQIDKGDLAVHHATERTHNTEDADNQAAKRRVGKEVAQAYARLSNDLSTGTKVEMPGVGGVGEATVNFRDIIMSKYANAWSPPADLENNVPVVSARITIARDGSVTSAHITTPSGNRSMDLSIERALETVTFIVPFPASSTEQERTVTVTFDLRLKRQSG